MNIQWVLADGTKLKPNTEIEQMKSGGGFWGSWKTWKNCSTDNVVCHNPKKAKELIKRDFQSSCNLYIPNSTYLLLDRPKNVRLYAGDFLNYEVDNQDEIISMNLAASCSDIVLLLGFDWSFTDGNIDNVKIKNYYGLVTQAIKSKPKVQWILVNHSTKLRKELSELDNLGQDSFDNVMSILKS